MEPANTSVFRGEHIVSNPKAKLLDQVREVLHLELGDLSGTVRAKPSGKLPVVLSGEEVGRVLARLEGTYGLMARLLYGTGMRLMECVRLRVKDVDFELNHIVVRDDADLHARDAQAGAGGAESFGSG